MVSEKDRIAYKIFWRSPKGKQFLEEQHQQRKRLQKERRKSLSPDWIIDQEDLRREIEEEKEYQRFFAAQVERMKDRLGNFSEHEFFNRGNLLLVGGAVLVLAYMIWRKNNA